MNSVELVVVVVELILVEVIVDNKDEVAVPVDEEVSLIIIPSGQNVSKNNNG